MEPCLVFVINSVKISFPHRVEIQGGKTNTFASFFLSGIGNQPSLHNFSNSPNDFDLKTI